MAQSLPFLVAAGLRLSTRPVHAHTLASHALIPIPLALEMWQSPDASLSSPDLVVEATLRVLPDSPYAFILLSVSAGLLALLLTLRNAWLLRQHALRQAADINSLRTRERRLRMTVRESEDGVVHLEPLRDAGGNIVDFLVTEANQRAASLFRRSAHQIEGLRTSALASLAGDTDLFRSLVGAVQSGLPWRSEVRAHPRHVTTSWLWVRAVPVDTGLSVTLADIRERKREAARLRRASLTDDLTGLLNRRGFITIADEQLEQARRAGQNSVLFYIDCDAFKQINDVFGHPTGDRALTEIARALRAAVRETDVISRMGGDEFTILAVDAVGDCAEVIRARIYDQLDALNARAVLPAALGVSIGHVYAPANETTGLADLLESADRDLIEQKHIRRATHAAMRGHHGVPRPSLAPRIGTRGAVSSQLTGAVTAA